MLGEVKARCSSPRRVTGPVRKVALVSSERSKGRKDFEEVLRSRLRRLKEHERPEYSFVHVNLQNAASIAGGIREAGMSDADLVAVVRGGGSNSDLDPFNEPVVAEALASLRQPALVAVGHSGDKVEAYKFAGHGTNTPSEAASLVAYLFHQGRKRYEAVQASPDRGSRNAEVIPFTTCSALAGSHKNESRLEPSGALPNPREFHARPLPAFGRSALRATSVAAAVAIIFAAGWKGAPLWDRLLLAGTSKSDTSGVQRVELVPTLTRAALGQAGVRQPVVPAQQRSAAKRPSPAAQSAKVAPSAGDASSGDVARQALQQTNVGQPQVQGLPDTKERE